MYKPEQTLQKGQSLIYPMDANPEDFFPECIKFTVKKRIGMNLDKIVNTTRDSYKNLVKKASRDGIVKFTPGGEKSILGKIIELGVKGVEFVADRKLEDITKIINGAMKAGTGNEYHDERLRIQEQNFEIIGSIYLNMPNSIQYNETAGWGEQSLGVAGDAARQGINTGGSGMGDVGARMAGAAVGNAGNIAGAGVGGMLGMISSTLGIGMGLAGGAFAGETLQKGIESGLSIAQNPYMEMMFSGIGFRNFKFDFVFRPRHEKEVQVVSRILKAFREYSRPSWNPQFGGQSFMQYPMEFNIQFLTLEDSQNKFSSGFDTNEYLPKLKPCVLASVDTNYTPQSIWAAHRAGAPVAVTLGLSFMETELVTAEDIQRDDWPMDGSSSNPNSSEPIAIGNDARMNPGGAFTGGR
jgi:hypothetical protein